MKLKIFGIFFLIYANPHNMSNQRRDPNTFIRLRRKNIL